MSLANPGFSELVQAMNRTIQIAKRTEKMGNLFNALTEANTSSRKGLVTYRAHRFLEINTALTRVLMHWQSLSEWFKARSRKAARTGEHPPNAFPLRWARVDLEQHLFLLKPVSSFK